MIEELKNDLDRGALRLLSEYRECLLRHAKTLVSSYQDAEDLVFCTIERVLAKADTYDESKGDLLTWMKTIMVNFHRDGYRRKLAKTVTYCATEELDDIADDTTNETILRNSDSEYIRQVVATLPPELREVIVLQYFAEQPIVKVAKILAIPPGTVASRVHLAKKILMKKLAPEFGKAKKPLAVLGAFLLGAMTLFGAYQTGLVEAVKSYFTAETPVTQNGEVSSEPTSKVVNFKPTSTFENNENTETKGEEPMKLTKTLKTATVAAAMTLVAVGSARADVIYVKPGGTGDGSSWANASDLGTAVTGLSSATYDIWCAAGTYTLTEGLSLSTTATLIGGFAADDDGDPGKKAAGKSVLDGANTLATLITVSGSGARNLEGFTFSQAQALALSKAGNCTLNLTNCLFTANAASSLKASAGTVNLVGCVFSKNVKSTANESGTMVDASYATLKLTDCLIDRNGVPFDADPTTSFTTANLLFYQGVSGSMTFTRCRFVGNRIHARGDAQGLIYGSTGSGSVLVHLYNCQFIGNTIRNDPKATGNYRCGLVSYDMFQQVDNNVRNCTFAYNLFDVACGGCLNLWRDLSSYKAPIKVENSIFYGNRTTPRHSGALDVVQNNHGTMTLGFMLFDSAEAADNYASRNSVTITGTLDSGDPDFVTASIDDLLGGDGSNGKLYFAADKEDAVMAIDVHLLSSEGYRKNGDATWYTADATSKALDAGDPAMDVGDEPAPNGGIINLGAFGGTAEASKTPITAPAATVTSVAWPNEYTQPSIKVTMGGTGAYNAKVTISVSTNGTDWVFVSDVFTGVKNGDVIDWLSSGYAPVDGTFKVKVDITAPGANPFSLTSESYSVPAGKVLPPWAGKGGDPTKVIHVRAGATGAKNGTSWTTAFDNLKDALKAVSALSPDVKEIWIAGDFAIDSENFASTFSIQTAVTIRGGFAATENSPDERVAGARSTFDGATAADGGLGLNATKAVTIEGIVFTHFKGKALGLTSSTTLDITNCVFTGNVKTTANEPGDMVTVSGGTIRLTDCVIEQNGVPFEAEPTASYTTANAIFSLSDGSMTFTRCRFAANRLHAASGSTAILMTRTLVAGAIVCRNCAFVGNLVRNNPGNNNSYRGGLVFVAYSTSAPLRVNTFQNCTFAYNLIDMTKGTLIDGGWDSTGYNGKELIENCIFHGNRMSKRCTVAPCVNHTCGGGDGALTVRWCVFDDHIGACNANLIAPTFENLRDMPDPGFVSASIDDLVAGDGTAGNLYFKTDKADEVAALDVHLLSPEGYRKNGDETWYTDAETASTAIDAGDPNASVGDEPTPNGSIINLGAYGGTAEASKTPVTAPAATVTDVTWPNEYTQPNIKVTMGGTGAYNAKVTISVATNGTDWVFVSDEFANVKNGDVIDWLSSGYAPVEGTFKVKVDVTAPGADPFSLMSDTYPVPAGKTLPPWAGKGGDPTKVIHVRAGATGAKNGTSWTTAFDNLKDALMTLSENTATEKEVWISGDFEADPEDFASTFNIKTPVTIRGGFAASENSPEERAEETFSVLDGCDDAANLKLTADGKTVRFERLRFTRWYTRALYVTGNGTLMITNCFFEKNGRTPAAADGRAIYSTTLSKVVLSGCEFADHVNTNMALATSAGAGAALRLGATSTLVNLTIDNCLFVSNGLPHDASVTNGAVCGFSGVAINACANPINITNTRFIGNRNGGGTICSFTDNYFGRLNLAVFRNCLFLGNETDNSLLYVYDLGSPEHRVTLENCTFAYNLLDRPASEAVVVLRNANLTMKNTIFHSNLNRGGSSAVRDLIYIYEGAPKTLVGDTSYSSFDSEGSFFGMRASVTNNILEGVRYGDPQLVTTTKAFSNLVRKVSVNGVNRLYFDWEQEAEVMAMNAHLRGLSGYTDETTGEKVAGKGKTSPCVDKGDPASDYSQEPKPNGKRINMGCYGGTPWATRSPGGGALIIR